MKTASKLLIATGVIASVTAYMAYLGTAASWKYYLTVDECLADAHALVHQRMRVSGKVAIGSLDIARDKRQAKFELCGALARLPIRCMGALPDNFAENMEVVVEGQLDESGLLQANQVLTRCASKYTTETAPLPTQIQAFAKERHR